MERTVDGDGDLLIIGSGGGALVTALTAARAGLKPLLVEKTEYYGGSTALSGGAVWVPTNHLMAAEGVSDSLEQARTYMRETVGDRVPVARQDAYLANAPSMLESLCAHPEFEVQRTRDYSDYYPERPGGLAAGRSVEAVPLDGRRLGPELRRLRQRRMGLPAGMAFTASEYRGMGMFMTTWGGRRTALKVGLRTVRNMATGVRYLTMGAALVARLRLALMAAGIPLWLESPFVELLVEDRRVVGAIVEREGRRIEVRAPRGVVIAAGGFEHNAEMRQAFQQQPIGTEWTLGSPGNTGDGIRAGISLGAAVDLMDDAWWGPTSLPNGRPFFHVGERGYPGAIIVDGAGQRFMDESISYVDAVHTMYEHNTPATPSIPAWFIMDQRFRNRYLFGLLFPRQKFPQKYIAGGYVTTAGSLGELAAKVGINPDGLKATVARFNGFARTGRDLDFGRGESAYDRYYGDPSNRPNPNLGRIEKPPYYAVAMWPGDLGTKGGLVADENARVLRTDGSVIEGLYAVGNASAAVMGNSYPGPGATIGSAMTFGYIAARHAAGIELASPPVRDTSRPGRLASGQVGSSPG
jgi:3-oxosteroid 1-dehydrogenase